MQNKILLFNLLLILVIIINSIIIFTFYIPKINKRRKPIITSLTPPVGISPGAAIYLFYTGSVPSNKIILSDLIYLQSKGLISFEKDKANHVFHRAFLYIFLLPMFIYFSVSIPGNIFVKILFLLFYVLFTVLMEIKFKKDNFVYYAKKTDKKYLNDLPNYLDFLYKKITSVNNSEEDSFLRQNIGRIIPENEYLNEIKKEIKVNKVKNIQNRYVIFFCLLGFIPVSAFFINYYFNSSITTRNPYFYIVVISIFLVINYIVIAFHRYRVNLHKTSDYYYSIAGLHKYLKYAEVDRLRFEYDEKTVNQKINELIPYIFAFGFDKRWFINFKPALGNNMESSQTNV